MINLQVTWNQPTSDHPIQHYEVQYRKQGVSSWTSVTLNPNTRQTTIRNVAKGSVYNVQVRAVSDVGSGQWKSATSQRTYRGIYMNKIPSNCLFTIYFVTVYMSFQFRLCYIYNTFLLCILYSFRCSHAYSNYIYTSDNYTCLCVYVHISKEHPNFANLFTNEIPYVCCL